MKSFIKHVLILMGLFSFIFISSCKKDNNKQTNNTIEYSTVTDVDGNVYKTVKIGNQWWMAENLKVTRYNNLDTITYIGYNGFYLDSTKWNNMKTGAYCINDGNTNGSNINGKLFGFLYNFYVIYDSRKIAPAGWHIPCDDEWKQLETTLGMSSVDANKMNFRGTNEGNKLKLYLMCNNNPAWDLPQGDDKYTVWPTNESGFSAVGGGCCMYNGIIDPTLVTGFWWTSTINTSSNQPWYRYLDWSKPNVFRFYGPMTYGFSIRCVKD